MMRILWAAQDLIDAVLDHLPEKYRWAIINFLMDRHLLDCCVTAAVGWSMFPGESLWEISECDYCRGDSYTYCGKIRPSEVGP